LPQRWSLATPHVRTNFRSERENSAETCIKILVTECFLQGYERWGQTCSGRLANSDFEALVSKHRDRTYRAGDTKGMGFLTKSGVGAHGRLGLECLSRALASSASLARCIAGCAGFFTLSQFGDALQRIQPLTIALSPEVSCTCLPSRADPDRSNLDRLG
jgi:hypothetical protein